MLKITMAVNIPAEWVVAVKEDLAMLVEERYGGDTRVISVEAEEDQICLF